MTHNEKAIVAKEIFDYLELNPEFATEIRKTKRFNKTTVKASMIYGGGIKEITMSELLALSDVELEALQTKLNAAKAAKKATGRRAAFLYYPRRSRF